MGIVVVAAMTFLGAQPAGAAKPPKGVAIVYGDSLVWESTAVIGQAMHTRRWDWQFRGGPAQAPCDWLTTLDDDLATHHPDVVLLATAGNSFRTCMNDPEADHPWPVGSAGYYAKYRADLDLFFSKVTASGARMVFAKDPPMMEPTLNAAVLQIIAIARDLAGDYHGVSIATKPRKVLAKKDGYVSHMKCLPGETAAMGCTGGQIAVRTVTSSNPSEIGLHLCPGGPGFPQPCDTYSSGAVRFGRAIAVAAMKAPAPVLP